MEIVVKWHFPQRKSLLYCYQIYSWLSGYILGNENSTCLFLPSISRYAQCFVKLRVPCTFLVLYAFGFLLVCRVSCSDMYKVLFPIVCKQDWTFPQINVPQKTSKCNHFVPLIWLSKYCLCSHMWVILKAWEKSSFVLIYLHCQISNKIHETCLAFFSYSEWSVLLCWLKYLDLSMLNHLELPGTISKNFKTITE